MSIRVEVEESVKSTIGTLSKVMGGDPREVPHWTQPIVLSASQLRPLGSVAGRQWQDWGQMRLEVEEVGEPIEPNDRAIAKTPYLRLDQADGGYLLQALKPYVRGSYAARLAVVARGPAAPAAPAPVDALDAVSLLSGIGGAGKYRFRGVEAILARLKDKAGIEFRPVGDGAELLVIVPGGTLSAARRDELLLLAPLLTSYLATGSIPDCEGRHREPVPATTLALAVPSPRLWCRSPECMP